MDITIHITSEQDTALAYFLEKKKVVMNHSQYIQTDIINKYLDALVTTMRKENIVDITEALSAAPEEKLNQVRDLLDISSPEV